MSQAETALWSGNFTSDENNWRNYWDEPSAVDFFIVQELTGNPDGFTSIYLYKERGIDKFFFGPVWDFDKAYNNDNRRANLFNDLMVHRGFFTMDGSKPWNEPEVNWHGRMWEDPRFRRAVRDRWNNKKNELRLAASRILNDEPQRMEHSISANFTRWDVSEQALYDAMPAPATYEQGITTLKNYINVRFSYLDGLFNSEQ